MLRRRLIIFIFMFLSPSVALSEPDCSKAAKLLSTIKVLGARNANSAEVISEAYLLCPNSVEVAYVYGSTLMNKGEFEEAMKVYSKNNDQSLEIPKAILLTEMGKFDEASQLLEKVIGEDPRKVEALQALSNLEFKRQNYAESERLARLAIQEQPENGDLFYNLGITLEKLNRLDEARLALLNSNRLNSNSALTSCALARVYMRQSNIIDAETSADKAVSIEPSNYLVWFTKGLVSQQKGSHQLALDSFSKAENINPKDYRLKLANAVSEINLGKKESVETIRELSKNNPEQLDIIKSLLWALIYLKDYKSALEQKSYFSRFENDSIALNNLGVLHKHLGKEEEAKKFFEHSLELNPALKQAQKNLQLLLN